MLRYHSPDPDVASGLLVRSVDAGHAIEWETAPVPADVAGEFASFVWLFGLDVNPDAHRFTLAVNGEPWFEFRNPLTNDVREWTITGPNGASLQFRATMIDRFDDLMGYATLRVPRAALTPGRPLRLSDASDLGELLFPGNRNQQHAFLALWITLKWSDERVVSNLAEHRYLAGVSRRTLERVRAKLRRLGLLERVSRFSPRHGYRDGWVLSTRFERGLQQLAERVAAFRLTSERSPEKDELLLHLAAARCSSVPNDSPAQRAARTSRGETP